MHKATLLIVDDDPSILRIIRKILHREGYRCVEADSGTEALRKFRAEPPDLVLLDLALPDIEGYQIARDLFKIAPQIPVVILSAHGTIQKAVELTKMGIYDFITKPLDRNRLLVTVRNALAKAQLEQRVARLQADTFQKYRMIGQSPAMRQIYDMIERVGPTDVPVLITGENGVGKELVARALHSLSPRKNRPMVSINCAAVPRELLESDLFGHTKGAFTHAVHAKKGRIEIADGGTLFLDEIGEMDLSMQVKLLRFLDSGEIQKVGSTETLAVDVRLIAATNRDLHGMVKTQQFREDLYYRIQVVNIHIPPLRERIEDIPLLLDYFLSEYSASQGLPTPRLTPAALRYLKSLPWNGNIRELRNFCERVILLDYNEVLDLDQVKPCLENVPQYEGEWLSNHLTLREARQKFERLYITDVLNETQGNVTHAARRLGIDRASLHRKMKELGI